MPEAKATEQAVRDAFRDQAKSCDGLGSPFTARLCRLIADRLKADTPVGARVLGWQGDPSGEKHLIGRADFHGRWVEWTGWQHA